MDAKIISTNLEFDIYNIKAKTNTNTATPSFKDNNSRLNINEFSANLLNNQTYDADIIEKTNKLKDNNETNRIIEPNLSKSLPLLEYDNTSNILIITQQAKHFLSKASDYELIIVATTGEADSGKSYVMNMLATSEISNKLSKVLDNKNKIISQIFSKNFNEKSSENGLTANNNYPIVENKFKVADKYELTNNNNEIVS